MSPRGKHSSNTKTNPGQSRAPSALIHEGENEETCSEGEEEQVSTRSRATGRSASSTLRVLAQVMGAIQKTPPPVAASTRATSTASQSTISRARTQPSTPSQAARSTNSTQASRNIFIENAVSPSAVARMPVASPQVMQSPPTPDLVGILHSPPAHSVAAIDAQGHTLDDASTLSGTDNGNAKAMRMLQQYFHSLAASGTVRSIVEEKELITSKLGIIYRKVKFINADTDLSFEGNIAKVLYKEMKIPDTYKAIWWEQMRPHVRKKLDERRSNCGAAIKKSIISKLSLIFLCLMSNTVISWIVCFPWQIY